MLEKNQDPFTALTATRASSGIIFSAKTLENFISFSLFRRFL